MSEFEELEARVARLERAVADLMRGQGKRFSVPEDQAPSGNAATTGDPGVTSEVQDLVSRGKMTHAIKAYRDATGAGLKEAKDAVEALRDAGGPTG